MSHPTEPELMEFLYDELEPAQRVSIESHLRDCDACRQRVESWRHVRGAMQSWTIADRKVDSPWATPARFHQFTRYAIAASILIAFGFALARFTTRNPSNLAADPAVVETIRAELKKDLSVQLTALHREYREGLDRRLRQLEAERLAEYQGLRQDVETVALRTQEEFLRLTSATGTSGTSNSSN